MPPPHVSPDRIPSLPVHRAKRILSIPPEKKKGGDTTVIGARGNRYLGVKVCPRMGRS